ncbi:metalloregulator ArsR/SmtB family transcription factor [Rhodobacterales bacterium HKCCE3408]|nr:metalloregulator ArsR/SmtB family transcription factor [Rhodobacterales bacterium HKCCE3408]
MAKETDPMLDNVFGAMADPTRRAIIARLSDGPAPVKELAEPHGMALSSFLKHIGVLERAGLVTTTKRGRVRTCRLQPEGFRPAEVWLAARRRHMSGRIDTLASLLTGLRDDKPE